MDLDADLGIRPVPAFAHASEAELARILDFYAVAWEYEPRTFPILFDRSGTVLESFSPDFYLPELDLYLELTTLKQRLVRKKNRKLRRLRELYPGVQIKLLYARDFRALLFKYGKLSLAEALTGAHGQTTPPEARPLRPVAGALPADPASAQPAPGPGIGGRSTDDPSRRADHGHRRGRRTRAEARARAASRLAMAGEPGDAEVTA
jgi:hypoxanthine phosphoribosyltransferase